MGPCSKKPVKDFSKEDFRGQFKGALSGLRQFLAVKSPSKMMKNAFFISRQKLKIFKFLS